MKKDFTNIGRKDFAGLAVDSGAIRILGVTIMAKVQSRAPATFARWVNRLCPSLEVVCGHGWLTVFEQMGKAIPNSIHNERINSPARKGLKLSR